MPVVPDINYHAPATQATFKPIRDAIAGEPGYEVRVYHDHATEYALNVRNNGDGPVALFRNADGTTMLEITQGGSTFGALAPGSFNAPALAWADPTLSTLGFYRAGTGAVGLASGDSTRTIKMGAGSGAFGMVEVHQTNATPEAGLYSSQGGLPSTGVTPSGSSVLGDVVLAVDGGSYAAVEGSAYVVSGTAGYAYGGKFAATAEDGTSNASGLVGVYANARDTATQSHVQVLTGLLVNAQGSKASDVVQGAEIVVGTRSDGGYGAGTNSTPTQRVCLLLSTLDSSNSRRGTSLDALQMWGRKAPSAGDFTFVQTWTNGIHLGLAGDIATWPFQEDSALIRCDASLPLGSTNQIGSLLDLSNTHVRDSIITASGAIALANVINLGTGIVAPGGQIMKLGSGGSDPAYNVLSTTDASGQVVGWVGVGVVPTSPIHVKTAETAVLSFAGTTANFTATTVGSNGAASAMPTPLGYLRIKIGGSSVKLAYFNN